MRSVLFLSLLLLAGCDDMNHQAKRNPYERNAGDPHTADPAQTPAGTVQFGEKPSLPPPLTLALIERGQDRFRQFCTPCHSELGDGHGMVVQRGFSPPPSYHIARLHQVDTQHFYDVITNGYGAMYSFAQRVPPPDRWAIAAYIRALQLSEEAKETDLTPEQRTALANSR
jgi:mono/diheme cytochrome c family protein